MKTILLHYEQPADFIWILLVFPLFPVPASNPGFPLHLIFSDLWQFLSLSLSFTTLRVLRSTGQVLCRRFCNLNLSDVLLMIRCRRGEVGVLFTSHHTGECQLTLFSPLSSLKLCQDKKVKEKKCIETFLTLFYSCELKCVFMLSISILSVSVSMLYISILDTYSVVTKIFWHSHYCAWRTAMSPIL